MAFATGLAALDGDTVADSEAESGSDIWTDGGDDSCGFMAEDEWFANGKIAITAVDIVVY